MSITNVSAASAAELKPAAQKMRRRKPRWGSSILAIVFSVVWVFPVYWMINTAFKPRDEAMTSKPLFVPHHPTLENFNVALNKAGFLEKLGNSAIVVAGTLVIAILLGFFASAALSRFRFKGRRSIMIAILIIQMLPATAMLIPQFMVFQKLNMLNSYFALILAYVATALPFSIWVMRGFFIAIPKGVEEAAEIDGANTWQILTKILLPLVAPGIIATSIFAFIAAWNDYIFASVIMSDPSKYTLPVWLASFTNPYVGTDFGGQMAASVLFSLPVVIFFLIIQRNLVTGMSAGAVKG